MDGDLLRGTRPPRLARRRRATGALLVALAAALLAGGTARGDDFVGRGGASGLLDVPDGEALPPGVGRLALEWGYRTAGASPASFGPTPLSIAVGLSQRLEAGFALRESTLPGDPEPAAFVVGTAAKLCLLEAAGVRPALALSFSADRLNARPVLGARVAASTDPDRRWRLAAFLGGERSGATGGMALSIRVAAVEVVADAVVAPDGWFAGAAIRGFVRNAGISVGVVTLPGGGQRVSFGLALQGAAPGASTRRRRVAEAAHVVEAPAAEEPATEEPPEERTHGRLRIHEAHVPGDGARGSSP